MMEPALVDNVFCQMVLNIEHAGRLGYVRPSDEWMDGMEPLPDVLQDAAHRLVEAGFLPEFERFMLWGSASPHTAI